MSNEISTRLQNLYLRGFRRAVSGLAPLMIDASDRTAYTTGYNAGERALKQAMSSAKEYARASLAGERIKP
jgi:hypothetical protein